MKKKINKCPRCDAELIRKAWIADYTAILADTCDQCGYTTKITPLAYT
jgi:transcription elongation factor Elf1